MQKTDIKSQTLEELKNTVLELGEKPFVQNSSMNGCM